ncbi:hypothetical protein FO519_003094 [Halicephalobus sp. NKZ332]|nr:hypothetical protein FO519_003094 [Halicephalobus sp. NKZ332]
MKLDNNCIFYSNVIEAELRRRFLTVSYKKLKAAQKGGVDPLRKSLHVLRLMNCVQKNNIRLEDECSALLYIQITPNLPRHPNSPRMTVVIEQAPPQRVEPPTPMEVPQQEDAELLEESEVSMEDEQDGSSMARKRKSVGADARDSKLRIYEGDSNP